MCYTWKWEMWHFQAHATFNAWLGLVSVAYSIFQLNWNYCLNAAFWPSIRQLLKPNLSEGLSNNCCLCVKKGCGHQSRQVKITRAESHKWKATAPSHEQPENHWHLHSLSMRDQYLVCSAQWQSACPQLHTSVVSKLNSRWRLNSTVSNTSVI